MIVNTNYLRTMHDTWQPYKYHYMEGAPDNTYEVDCDLATAAETTTDAIYSMMWHE